MWFVKLMGWDDSKIRLFQIEISTQPHDGLFRGFLLDVWGGNVKLRANGFAILPTRVRDDSI